MAFSKTLYPKHLLTPSGTSHHCDIPPPQIDLLSPWTRSPQLQRSCSGLASQELLFICPPVPNYLPMGNTHFDQEKWLETILKTDPDLNALWNRLWKSMYPPFSLQMDRNPNMLRIPQWNCQSLKNKLNELQYRAQQFGNHFIKWSLVVKNMQCIYKSIWCYSQR